MFIAENCFSDFKIALKMLTNDSLAEEITNTNMTSVQVMPDYVVQSKFILEGVLLPILASFGFLGEFVRLTYLVLQ